MRETLKRFFRDDEGATMVEYGLMVALVAIVLIVVVVYFSGGVYESFARAGDTLETASGGTSAGAAGGGPTVSPTKPTDPSTGGAP